ASGTESIERTLRADGHRLEPDYIFRPPGRMHLASGDHCGDAAVHVAVNPSQLVLPWSPVAGDRVYVAVDQPRSQRSSARVDHGCGIFRINVLLPSNCDDSAINGD